MIPVSQVIPVIPASQVIPVIPVSQVIPVIPVSQVIPASSESSESSESRESSESSESSKSSASVGPFWSYLIFVSWNVHSFLQRSILFVICPARFLLQVCRDKTLKLKMFSNTIHYTQVHNDQENILKYFKGWIRYLVNFKISSST